MAPLPNPRTPSDVFLHDIAVSLRVLSDRDDDEPADGGRVPLREPVEGVDATPTVHTSAGRPQPPTGEPAAGEPAGEFDPSEHTVDEVNDYLADADPDEQQRVLDAEKAGKDRQTVKAPEPTAS